MTRALALDARMNERAPVEERFDSFVEQNVDFVWRSLRSLGVAERELDDAVQEVFIVAARRMDEREVFHRGFLFRTAMNVALHARRSHARRRESGEEVATDLVDSSPLPDELLERRQAELLLQAILARLPLELRSVFVLYELEQFTMPQISLALDVPTGTVASRLRRARELFRALVAKLEKGRAS